MDNIGIEREIPPYRGKLKPEFIAKARRMFDKYKADKEALHNRITDNNKWYRAQYWKIINPRTNEPEPATAFIFSAIENKYADAIDNFPVPNLLEREPSDTETAKTLSKIIPVQLEMSGFKKVYKDNWRRKLKHGTAVYGVFYNEDKDDIDIRAIDLMSIYCDMHVRDVQDSQFLFITNAVDNDILREQYPEYRALFTGDAQVQSYSGPHKIEDRTEIVDCYYKKNDGSLHMMKICGTTVIDATEDIEGYENGLYDHGLYPVVFDVLYPEEDSPFGFGIVDVIRNPQEHIDKLDAIIIKNAHLSGKQRYLLKDQGNINEDEFRDFSNEIIHVKGNIDETHIRSLQADALPHQVLEHRTEKINELKEVIGNRDIQQGGTQQGVTAASGITAMQQAGQKLSRSIIDDSYDAYKAIVIMMIDLMREFYTSERIYRITNETGGTEFAEFDNTQLIHEEAIKDPFGFPIDFKYRRTEFDIDVIPQRENPFTKESNNQTVLELWNSGFFLPQNLDVSVIALQLMNFDGREKLIGQLQELRQQQMMQQQAAEQQMMAEQAMQSAQISAGDREGRPYGGAETAFPTATDAGSIELPDGDRLIPIGNYGG